MNSTPRGAKANNETSPAPEKSGSVAPVWTETGAVHHRDHDGEPAVFVVNRPKGQHGAVLTDDACGNIHWCIQDAERALRVMNALEDVRDQWPYFVRPGAVRGDLTADGFKLTREWGELARVFADYLEMKLRKIASSIPNEDEFSEHEVEGV